ncbi:hypothetical protein ZWY2020_047322 [Hordeum vulgare]|nr:hypothetical protein ZWY2020_047322 [Hordeum vulgare]
MRWGWTLSAAEAWWCWGRPFLFWAAGRTCLGRSGAAATAEGHVCDVGALAAQVTSEEDEGDGPAEQHREDRLFTGAALQGRRKGRRRWRGRGRRGSCRGT